jgi:thioredoxin 1
MNKTAFRGVVFMEIPKLSEASFEPEVLQSNQPVLVDFTAVWCHPCKQLDPVVAQLAEDWQGKVKIVKLDVDDNTNLATAYQILSVPTLMLFIAGKPVERVSGFQDRARLLKRFVPHLQI